MNVQLDWLNELVDLSGLSLDEIVNKLSLYSTEVEGVSRVVSGTNLVVGHVLECVDHPDSDHLHVCKVDTGSEVLQIVCGAPNVKTGQYVIVALIDAVLPGDFKIKKSKIRGVESFGMICSLKEIGMENKYIPAEFSDGIYYFKDEVKVGSPALEALGLASPVLELGLTPNRSDLLSMLGVAYEASACFDRKMKALDYKKVDGDFDKAINLKIHTPNCMTYYARRFEGLEIKESPRWLKTRLISFGVRPINNVVDITNYILALFGQPLHAFDSDKLGNTIEVRMAEGGEKIVTLDNIERTLDENDIVITNGKEAVAIAGVMGGLSTEITDETKNMTLEVAEFNPTLIRLTSQKLNLRSESSNRFEKGIDSNRIPLALEYATYLLKELCNAKVSSHITSHYNNVAKEKEIHASTSFISKALGVKLEAGEILDVFKRLQFRVELDKDDMKVYVPSRRLDVNIPDDLVEEVGRIYGYEKLPLTLPTGLKEGGLTNYQKRRKLLKHTLVTLGLNEVITYSLVSHEENEEFNLLKEEGAKPIKLMHPISSDREEARMSLLPSMINHVNYLNNRKIKDVRAFEVARVYSEIGGKYFEDETLSIALANSFASTLWKGSVEKVDFYLLKGIVDTVFKDLNVELTYKTLDKESNELHPTRTALIYLGNKLIGYMGAIHPKYALKHDLKDLYVAEIRLADILSIELPTVIYKPISKVPSVERDIALVMNKDINASDIVDTIKSVDNKLLSDVKIFDLYVGENVKDDEKSLAIKLVFTSYETLTDDVINNKVNKILKELEKKYQATLRQ